ncbi:ABC transporter substrate-binding protein [Rhodococcus sp. IEGM 1366]|uniref:ABC transporter substrate-binding protein n=1 Tax=Rhodococcus sp. IEGM 1366 TaxID=3082223 RepID=UPI002955C5CB|nr:ABC transporter substrate-binding protein [Rhodococcus sp. IEGM 1366]MDV8071309.1 ABC transporter substrate-binding protein [Rhodococcus sp. IEGM 1366]
MQSSISRTIDTRSTITRHRRAGVAVVAAALSVAVVSGCSPDSGSTTAAAAAAAAECESATPVTIMMGTSDMDISYSPYALLANQLGYFAEECIDATVTTTGGQTTTQQALIGKAADITLQTPDSLVVAAEKERLPIKMFYNLIPRSTYEIVSLPGGDVTSDKDLAGAVIGLPALTDSLKAYVTARLKDAGIPTDGVQFIATGYGGTSMEALKSGQIDAFVGWPGLWAAYRNSGYEMSVLPEPSWQTDYYGMGMGALDSYIDENPEIIEGVSRALAKSSVFLSENPTQAIELFWDEFPARGPLPGEDKQKSQDQTMAVLESTMKLMDIGTAPADQQWGKQTEERWKSQVQYNIDAGLVTKDLDPNLFFTNEFNEAANDFDRAPIIEQADAQ